MKGQDLTLALAVREASSVRLALGEGQGRRHPQQQVQGSQRAGVPQSIQICSSLHQQPNPTHIRHLQSKTQDNERTGAVPEEGNCASLTCGVGDLTQ